MFGVIGWVIFGFLVGAVAKLLMPGKDPGGMIVTILLGIAGSVVGGYFGRWMGWYREDQWGGFLMATAGAFTLLYIYRLVNKKK